MNVLNIIRVMRSSYNEDILKNVENYKEDKSVNLFLKPKAIILFIIIAFIALVIGLFISNTNTISKQSITIDNLEKENTRLESNIVVLTKHIELVASTIDISNKLDLDLNNIINNNNFKLNNINKVLDEKNFSEIVIEDVEIPPRLLPDLNTIDKPVVAKVETKPVRTVKQYNTASTLTELSNILDPYSTELKAKLQ